MATIEYGWISTTIKKTTKSAQSQKLNNPILSDMYVTYRNQKKKLKFFRTE